MTTDKVIRISLEGLNMDRVAYPSGEVLWKKPKLIFLEYLLSTGTLYIDTGVLGDINLLFETKLIPINTPDDSTFFGYYRQNPNSNSASQLNRFHFGKKIPGVGYPAGGSSLTAFVTNQEYIATYSNKIFTIGTESIDYASKTISDPLSCYLFARHLIVETTEGVGTYFSGKIYYFIIKDSSDNIIREFRPCKYNGTLGMYDVQNNKFYKNKGTGTFIAGPELPLIKYVDYIESTGTLYIKTDYKVNSNTTVETNINLTLLIGEGGYRSVFGCGNNYNTTDNFMVSLTTVDNRAIIGYAGGAGNVYVYLNDKSNLYTKDITVRLKTSLVGLKYNSLDYVTKNTNKTTIVNPTRKMYIFSINTANSDLNGKHVKMKLYDFKIWDKYVLVRDFRPCKYIEKPWEENPEIKIGLWDEVSLKFFENAGTGEFLIPLDEVIFEVDSYDNETININTNLDVSYSQNNISINGNIEDEYSNNNLTITT